MTRFQPTGFGKLARSMVFRASCAVALMCVAMGIPNAYAYPTYDDGTGHGCVECHDSFKGGPMHLLHTAHVTNFAITACTLCHADANGGDTPVRTYTSGPGGGFGCAGCHGQDYGEKSMLTGKPKATAYGLRLVHAYNGVTVCQNCHQANPNPVLPENVAPPYYGQGTSNLMDPCSSEQENNPALSQGPPVNTVGLDNDGNGEADWPADQNCAEPVPTTTTTTTTTLPVACGPAPAAGCIAPDKAVLLVSEKTAGKEKLKVSLSKLQPVVTPSQLGDPVGGGTSYAVCIYDAQDVLRGHFSVARAGQDVCNLSLFDPCWAAGSKGIKYADKSTTADGILTMALAGGDAGKGKIGIAGKNNASAGQTSLPTGIASLLQNNDHATVQVVTSDAACFGATVTQVKTADGSVFSASWP